jgi:protein-tyrosine phosphatase
MDWCAFLHDFETDRSFLVNERLRATFQSMEKPYRILFVCLGNICRSPAAEGVMRSLVEQQGLSEFIEVDSAGTASWHIGKLPDDRMRHAGKRRGYDLCSRARQVQASDLNSFDLILAMDESNLQNLRSLDDSWRGDPKVKGFCDYCSQHEESEVPDPYYGGPEGFEKVLDLLEDGCAGVLKEFTEANKKRLS